MDIDSPIPYLTIDTPIPYRLNRRPTVPAKMKKNPKVKAFDLAAAADELAYLAEARDVLQNEIDKVKGDILTAMGPLPDAHNELRGAKALWDVRSLPTSTISWKAVAENMGAPAELVESHTTRRTQISFKRVPMEVSK